MLVVIRNVSFSITVPPEKNPCRKTERSNTCYLYKFFLKQQLDRLYIEEQDPTHRKLVAQKCETNIFINRLVTRNKHGLSEAVFSCWLMLLAFANDTKHMNTTLNTQTEQASKQSLASNHKEIIASTPHVNWQTAGPYSSN